MTCAECKYQWCWLCGEKYSYGHYSKGRCNGRQFSKIDYLPKDDAVVLIRPEMDRRLRRRCWCCRCLRLYKHFFCSLVKYLPLIWFLGVIYISVRVFHHIALLPVNNLLFCLNVFLCYSMAGFLFISFQLIFTGLFTIIALPILFVWPLIEPFNNILESWLDTFNYQ